MWTAIFCCVCAVFYYSWLPHSNLSSEHYLPNWLIIWANEYGNIRTAIPFIIFGFLSNTLHVSKSIKRGTLSKKILLQSYFKILGISMALVATAEIGQFFIPDRSPDFKDVIYGIIGAQIGFLLHLLILKFYKSFLNYAK
jgi:glycopeptide antibiotics resistance protein